MDRFKFRAWSKLSNKMVYQGDDQWFEPNCDVESFKNQTVSLSTVLTSDDFIPMQAVGMNDKEGKPIFESDIVRYYRVDGDDGPDLSPVVYKGAAFTLDYSTTCLKTLSSIGYVFEVVGNIYDNPEL